MQSAITICLVPEARQGPFVCHGDGTGDHGLEAGCELAAELGFDQVEIFPQSAAAFPGRPLGRLLAAQWVESPADGGRPRFVVLGEGASATIQAATDGPLYLKLNEPPGDMADDTGSIAVEIQ
jgi:hypothetical protein